MKPFVPIAVALIHLTAWSTASAQQQYPQQKFWRYASPRIEIPQTGQAASVHNPECGDGANNVAAVAVVAKVGASALDKYLSTQGVPTIGGYGITSALLAAVDNPGNRQWLADRLGISNGKSKCATQCVAYPTAQKHRLSVLACLSETGGDGLDCGANGWSEGQWMGAWNLTHAEAGRYTVSCMTGKNWSANRNRWFWVVATDQNPLNGSAMPTVYR